MAIAIAIAVTAAGAMVLVTIGTVRAVNRFERRYSSRIDSPEFRRARWVVTRWVLGFTLAGIMSVGVIFGVVKDVLLASGITLALIIAMMTCMLLGTMVGKGEPQDRITE